MRNVFKYHLDSKDTVLSLSESAKIRKIAQQHGRIVAWAEVDNAEKNKLYEIRAFCTGEPLPSDIKEYEFLETVLFNDGDIVLHYYGKWRM